MARIAERVDYVAECLALASLDARRMKALFAPNGGKVKRMPQRKRRAGVILKLRPEGLPPLEELRRMRIRDLLSVCEAAGKELEIDYG